MFLCFWHIFSVFTVFFSQLFMISQTNANHIGRVSRFGKDDGKDDVNRLPPPPNKNRKI